MAERQGESRKAKVGRRKEEGGRRKEEGGRRKEEGKTCSTAFFSPFAFRLLPSALLVGSAIKAE
jgi:hypothetical protein